MKWLTALRHLKSDYRLERNFFKGVVGDAINVLLAAAAYNFKRAMRLLGAIFQKIYHAALKEDISLKYALRDDYLLRIL